MSTTYFVILVCSCASSNTNLTRSYQCFYEENIKLRKQRTRTSPNDGLLKNSRLEDDMKQRKVRGKQVEMAPESLLFKAISRVDFQETTPLDVYVGEVIVSMYQRNSKLQNTLYIQAIVRLYCKSFSINIHLYCLHISHVFNMVKYLMLK